MPPIITPNFRAPRGVCLCGHTGHGPGSKHADTHYHDIGRDHAYDRVYEGQGGCRAAGCVCTRFRWRRATSGYRRYLTKQATDAQQHATTAHPAPD